MTIILTKDGIKNTRRIVIDNSLNMSRIVNDNNILEFHTQGLRLPRFDNTFHQNYHFVDTSRNGVIYLDDSDNKFKFVQNDNRVTVDNSNFDNGVSSISLGDSGKSIIFNRGGTNRMKMDASGVHLNEGSAFITHPQDGLITGNIGIRDKIVFYNSNNVETSQMHYDSNAIIFESSNNHFDFKVGSGKIIMTIQDNEILHINSTGVGHNLNGNLPSNTLDISGNVSINYTGNSILNNKYLYSKGGIGIGVTCGTGQSLNINNKCIVQTDGDISFSDLSCNYIRVNDLKPQELLFDDGNDSSFNITNRLVFSTKTNNHNTLFTATNANNDDAYYFSTYNNNFSLYSNGYHRIFGDSIKMIEYNKESNESMIIGPTSYNESHLYDLNSSTNGLNWKITDCSFGFKSGGWDEYRRTNINLFTNVPTDTITHYKSNAFDISSGIIQNKYDNLIMNVTNSTTKKFIFNNDLEISGNLTINSGVINITRNNVYIYSEFSINSTSNPSIELNKNAVDSGYYLQASKNNEIKVNVSKLGMGVSPDGNNSTSASSDYVLDVSGEVYGLYPVGSVIMLEPTQSVPSGWALCDGSTLTPRNSYVDLSNVIGSKYGGNATTINLPNFNDSMPMGNPDPESGTTFESQSGSNEITENHMPRHSHVVANDNNFDISLNKTNMKFGNTLFTQETLNLQEHADWSYGNDGESVNGAMNGEDNTNGQGLKYITKTDGNCQGDDGSGGSNTIPDGAINTQQGVFKGRTQWFPIHHGITDTNTNNNSGADFIPSYATIKFIIYHGVH